MEAFKQKGEGVDEVDTSELMERFKNIEEVVSHLANQPEMDEVLKILAKICPSCKVEKDYRFFYKLGDEENVRSVIFYSYAKHFPELRKNRYLKRIYESMNMLFANYLKLIKLMKDPKNNYEEIKKTVEECKDLYKRIKRYTSMLYFKYERYVTSFNRSPVLKEVFPYNKNGDEAVEQLYNFLKNS